MLITDHHLAGPRLAEIVRAAVRGGVDAVQLREKDLPGGALLDLARRIGDVARAPEYRQPVLLVNTRCDVALAAGWHGVHLPENELPPVAARRVMGPHALIGASVHSLAAARAAAAGGTDYVLFGPVFTTSCKPGAAPQGLAALEELVAAVPIPVLAVGGITPANAPAVRAAGAHGIAVRSPLLTAPDPAALAAAYQTALQ